MKQNRLVSRLPFFVFNCQGSRHHPADYADKVLLAENHRHRVYGVGLRPGGHLRQVLRLNTGKALRNAQRPVHAVNGLYCLPGKASGLPGVIKAADVGLRQQLRQPLQAPGSGDAFRPASGQYPGLQTEAGLKHPTVYFLSSIMRTSFPWTITPHFRRDCKMEWGDGYCRGGRLCPSSAITQHFVGQGPCALPGVGGAGQRGEGTPPYTPFTDRISQGAAAHRRANRFPATVVPVNWGPIRAYCGRNP